MLNISLYCQKSSCFPSISYFEEKISAGLIFNYIIFVNSTSRADFRAERCKILPLDGWIATWSDREAADAFQLVNHHSGTLYKFK